MTVSTIAGVGFRILFRHWAVLLLLALLFAGPGALLTTAAGLRFTEVMLDIIPGLSTGEIEGDLTLTRAELERLLDPLATWLIASLVAGVLASIGALGYSAVVAADYHARRLAPGAAVRTALRHAPAAIGFMIVTSLVIAGLLVGALVLVGVMGIVLPGSTSAGGPAVFLALVIGVGLVVAIIYLTMRWAPAFPAMVEEDVGARDALSRSWHLSGDNVWRIFAVILIANLVGMLFSVTVGQMVAVLGSSAAPALGLDPAMVEFVLLAITSVILSPITPVLTAVLYFDLRARRDVAVAPSAPSGPGA